MRRATKAAACLTAGCVGAWAFTLSPQGYVGISDGPMVFPSLSWGILAAVLAGVLALLWRENRAPSPWCRVFGMLFGAVNYFATTLFAYDTWSFLNGLPAWGKAALCAALQGAAMACALELVCGWLCGQGRAASGKASVMERCALKQHAITARRLPLDRLCEAPRLQGFWRFYRRHTALACALLLVVCWLPYLAAFFPGTIIWDMGEMVAQFFGQREMTTWHPVFTTWILGGCVSIGRLLGSDNLGAFLFTALQTALLAYALGQSVALLRRMRLGRRWQFWAMALFGLTPIFASFAQAVGKDTLYAALLLVVTLRTVQALRFGRLSRAEWIECGVCALLTCLVRSNGLYVVAPTALLLLIVLKGNRARVLASMGAAAAAAVLFANVLIPALGIKDETASGLYSVCFQQSARTLRDCEVDAEEYAELDAVLDAANLATLYETNISDPVKYTFKQYGEGRAAEKTALARYRKTWLRMLGEHPLTYLEAFVAGNCGYYAFTPKIDAARTYNYQGGIRFVFETYELGDDARYLHTVQPAALEGVRTVLAAYARGWRRVPILNQTMQCAAYVWVLAACGLATARQKRWRELIGFLPAVLSLGVCLLSPVNDYFRYFLPIVAMLPILIGVSRTPARSA